ncbi:HEM4 domain-containing protein, partial [Haematococcus lacustris]
MSLSASGLLKAHAGFRRVPQASIPCRVRVASSALMLPTAPTTPSVWVDESGHDPLAPVPPLLGKRILITAPRQYAHKLAAKLVAAGARPLWVPGVSITALTPGSPEDLELGTALAALWPPGTSPAP